jgi:UDP-glucose 4-epimerase
MLSKLPDTECFSVSSENCDLLNPLQTNDVLGPLSRDAIVVYSAGITSSSSDSGSALTDNLTMLYNLIETLKITRPRKLIFLSSVEIYGIPEKLPISEDTLFTPSTLYGVGKITAELMLQRWYRQDEIPIAALRLPGIYGPGDKGFGLIGALIKSSKEQKEFNLIGGGLEQRDYVFVEDIVKIVIALSHLDFTELTLNIATGRSVAVADIVKQIFALYGECPLKHSPQTQNVCHLQFDISALKNKLPQLAMISLEEGLKKYKATDLNS